MSKWKPGDVALVNGQVALVWDDEIYPSTRLSFVYTDSDGDSCSVWTDEPGARPLAVIDPESREQVERLVQSRLDRIWSGVTVRDSTVDEWQTALREFANPTPPKPPEPTGLGAVVEDTSGKEWLRISPSIGNPAPWAPVGNVGSPSKWRNWRDLDVTTKGVPDVE